MKKTLITLAISVVTSLIPSILINYNLLEEAKQSEFLVTYFIVWTIGFIFALLIITDVLSIKETFFFLIRKKYISTTAIIRKERLTNVSYNTTEGGYGGFRQKQYKLEYHDKQGNRYTPTYTTGRSESQFASLLGWKVGTSLKIFYSPKKPIKAVIDKDYYKKRVKQKRQQIKDDWNKNY
nr:hypothetical protein [Enterococcus sp. DIV2402]MBO0464044.1 hypothetical protein [Enterococcus sp. DIV2402]